MVEDILNIYYHKNQIYILNVILKSLAFHLTNPTLGHSAPKLMHHLLIGSTILKYKKIFDHLLPSVILSSIFFTTIFV
jgi:hypothetical protein